MKSRLGLWTSNCGRGSFAALSAAALISVVSMSGCDSSAKTGALGGAGIGALAGQAIGGNTQATLIGAAAGAGIGYVIGNEKDKKHAKEMSQAKAASYPTHNEVGRLGGTRWALVSLAPPNVTKPYVSKIIEFRSNGRVITTTTRADGRVEVADENYRVVGDTLIVNRPGFLINARFSRSGGQLIVSAEEFRAVLQLL